MLSDEQFQRCVLNCNSERLKERKDEMKEESQHSVLVKDKSDGENSVTYLELALLNGEIESVEGHHCYIISTVTEL